MKFISSCEMAPNGWRLRRLAVFRLAKTILAGNPKLQLSVRSLSLGQVA
jgi:hypothetical protein